MYAEIISIGTELLMGEIVDTNAAYLAARLPGLGIELRWVSQVGDDMDKLSEVIQRALSRSDLTLTTGGLGPTSDDLTRECIARVLREEIRVDDRLLEDIKTYFRGRGGAMSSYNIKQAAIIPSAQAIINPRGTAPGWWVEKAGHTIVAMPGPPGEMERMWQDEVSPRLRHLIKGVVIVTRTLKTIGLSEAAVNEMIAPLFESTNPYLGIYARSDGIHLRAIAKAPTNAEALALIAPVEEHILRVLGPSIWGVDNETPEEQVGVLLKKRGLTLATMESFTGGLVASAITEVQGSSDYFRGTIVAYSNDLKVTFGVPAELIEKYGAVSPQVAEAMAEAACHQLRADVGVGTTGVAGPSELEKKPVGTGFIGIAYNGQTRSISGRYPPQRPLVRRRAASHALVELLQMLRGTGQP
ncbi:MAG: competence/damage-inducible protein A [Chloroflexi bacterium]|nr:competence/damage-inducible protein A [Chloroflexota bacterium]